MMATLQVGDRVRLNPEAFPDDLIDANPVAMKRVYTVTQVDKYVHARGPKQMTYDTQVFSASKWIAAEPEVPMVAMDADDAKALALLNDGFDRGQLVCDSFAATKSEQDDFARAMIRLERIVRTARAEVKP
ncbi:MAG: hypothetical protein JWO85_578 [Candidatus Eremiobacteraeota bacterium]|nr:hypothetical protein [Candidatus Eremiobacteraeota bacterium]